MLAIITIGSIVWGVVGFVIGALVFHNNKAKGDKVVEDLKQKLASVEDQLRNK